MRQFSIGQSNGRLIAIDTMNLDNWIYACDLEFKRGEIISAEDLTVRSVYVSAYPEGPSPMVFRKGSKTAEKYAHADEEFYLGIKTTEAPVCTVPNNKIVNIWDAGRIEGFDQVCIRDVPLGDVLNSQTADTFPLRLIDSWISRDRNWMIVRTGEKTFRLIPHNDKTRMRFYLYFHTVEGSVAYIKMCIDHIENPKS